jgi:hypothetical protein
MPIVTAPNHWNPLVQVRCDGCRRPIRAAADGVAVCELHCSNVDVGRVLYAHQAGRCRAAVERAATGPGGPPDVRPLDIFFAVLAANLLLSARDLDRAQAWDFQARVQASTLPTGAGPVA